MAKRLLAGLTPMLLVAASMTIPAAAQAEPIVHWFSDGKLITGQPVTVKTSGSLTFDLTQFGAMVTCKVKDIETISNPASGGPGVDEMLTFRLSGCSTPVGGTKLCPGKIEVIALGLPWHSHLAVLPPAPGIRDVLEGVAIEIRCKKGKSYVFAGNLSPQVGFSVLEFEGGAGLSGEFGTVTVTGKDMLKGPAGDKTITAA